MALLPTGVKGCLWDLSSVKKRKRPFSCLINKRSSSPMEKDGFLRGFCCAFLEVVGRDGTSFWARGRGETCIKGWKMALEGVIVSPDFFVGDGIGDGGPFWDFWETDFSNGFSGFERWAILHWQATGDEGENALVASGSVCEEKSLCPK